jgi:hypothetical protein
MQFGVFQYFCRFKYLFHIFKFDLLVLVLYLDDSTITRNSNQCISRCKKELNNEFDMKEINLCFTLWD